MAFNTPIQGERGRRFKILGEQVPGAVLTPEGWAVPQIDAVEGLSDELDSLDSRVTTNETVLETAVAEAEDTEAGDLIADGPGFGLVLRSPDGHYWRFTANDFGELVSQDLGTERPA